MDKRTYNIQVANQFDSYDIASINALAWKEAYAGIFPEEELNSIPIDVWAASWKIALAQGAVVLKIYHSNKIIGFSHLCKDDNEFQAQYGEINSLYLHPDMWRKGFGKELCIASLIKLKELGFDKVMIWVLVDNVKARSFYKALGFQETGVTRVCDLFSVIDLMEVQYIKNI